MKRTINNRNVGIDFLRILSAFFIIQLHIVGHGGIRDFLTPGSLNYYVIWFVILISFCSVNCFGLISGYVGYQETEKPHKSASFIYLWFQVVFYCFITVTIFKVFKMPDIVTRDFIEALFPISFDKYWYFSAYLGVFIFMPLINKCVREFSKTYMAGMIVVGVGAYSFAATVITRYSDPFLLKGGYGTVWLTFLYFIGAVIKKYKIEDRIGVSFLISIIVICLMATWIWKVTLISVVGHGIDDLLVIYISPTILLMSVCLLMMFSKLKLNSFMTKIISIIAPTTFGIYLFQDSDYFRKYIVAKRYVGYALNGPLIMIGFVFLTSLTHFLIGYLVDTIRNVLFGTIKLKTMSDRIGNTLDIVVNRLIKWLEERYFI